MKWIILNVIIIRIEYGKDVNFLRAKIKSNDSVNSGGSYVCKLDISFVGVVPISFPNHSPFKKN